jgi:nucleotide-binding universal stress UspA family protein
MAGDAPPVIAAYDGSPAAEAALRAAAELFGHHTILVVTVWEPGLAMLTMTLPDPSGFTYLPPSAEEVTTVDRAQRDHAAAIAEAGAARVRELGGRAEPLAVRDDGKAGETLAAIAEQRAAAAIVVGSRGLGAVRSAMGGSTSRHLLHEADRPVLVVRAPRLA